MSDKRAQSTIMWKTAAVAIAAAMAVACSDGGGSGGGGGKFQSSLKSLSGRLGGLAEGGKARISAIVGTGAAKKQIPAVIDKEAQTFKFADLPAGPKSIVVEQDGQVRSVKFPLSESAATKETTAIPETQLGAAAFDLGSLSLAATGDYLEAEHNPLAELVDTDGDGLFDFFDEDIDGDGLLNWDDALFFGEEWDEYADWSWEEEDFYFDDWDCDGDGLLDWEDWDAEMTGSTCGWEEDWDDYWGDDYWDGDDYDDGLWEDDCTDPETCWSDESGDEWGDESDGEWGDESDGEWGDESDGEWGDESGDESDGEWGDESGDESGF